MLLKTDKPLKPLSEITQEDAEHVYTLVFSDRLTYALKGITVKQESEFTVVRNASGSFLEVHDDLVFAYDCEHYMHVVGVDFVALAYLVRKGYDLGELSKSIQEKHRD